MHFATSWLLPTLGLLPAPRHQLSTSSCLVKFSCCACNIITAVVVTSHKEGFPAFIGCVPPALVATGVLAAGVGDDIQGCCQGGVGTLSTDGQEAGTSHGTAAGRGDAL